MSTEFEQLREHRARLILYVGPELAQAAGIPSRDELLTTLIDQSESRLSAHQLDELRELVEDDEVPRHEVFSALERDLTPTVYGRMIEKLLDDRGKPLPPLAKAIAALEPRIRGVLTPNLDRMLERAFDQMLDVHTEPVADLASRDGWLYKLHGTLRKHSTWRFTTEQMRQALYADPLQRALFQSLFLAHPIVFVGTRIDDPVLRDIIAQISALAQGQLPQHWMFVERSQAKPARRRRLAAAGIDVIAYDNDDGQHGGCVRMLRALADAEAEPAPAPAPAASPRPVVVAPRPAAPAKPAAPVPAAPAPARESLAILFATANPAGTDPLRLASEERIIREAIALSPNRDRLQLVTCPAVTFDDLRRALLRQPFDIVHLSGHSETSGLILEDALGDYVQISPKGLAQMFSSYAPPEGSLRCVVFNACFSISTGEEVSMDVPFAVAMNGPISDRGALEFSRGFYDALGAGCDIPRAFREGMTCVNAVTPGARFDATLLTTQATE